MKTALIQKELDSRVFNSGLPYVTSSSTRLSQTGADVSTRSYGDSINARNLVAVDGTLVRCLSTEEVALLAEDVQHGTDVRLSFVDPTSELITETFALSMGDFHDENTFLSFGSPTR